MAKVAVPARTPSKSVARRAQEPVWLVRIVVILFFVGFSAFLAREVLNFLRTLA